MNRLGLMLSLLWCSLPGFAAEGGPVAADSRSTTNAAVTIREEKWGSDRPAASANSSDPLERRYKSLLEEDDKALDEVDRMIKENQDFAAKGAGLPNAELNRRIRARLDLMKQAYEDFLREHPNHVRTRVAYGSFLGDIGAEAEAQVQLEKSLEMDKTNPAIYNNLANIYGHSGSVKKAFEYYARATELKPEEPVYYQNLATTVYLFRHDATNYYGINEQEVFTKALDLYAKALKLDPENFELATDLAQTYYGVRPLRYEPALMAWTNAIALARDDFERQGIEIHLARLKIMSDRLDEAKVHLTRVTDERYAAVKRKLESNLVEKASGSKTNAPAALSAQDPK